jgi:hypothetical protein
VLFISVTNWCIDFIIIKNIMCSCWSSFNISLLVYCKAFGAGGAGTTLFFSYAKNAGSAALLAGVGARLLFSAKLLVPLLLFHPYHQSLPVHSLSSIWDPTQSGDR